MVVDERIAIREVVQELRRERAARYWRLATEAQLAGDAEQARHWFHSAGRSETGRGAPHVPDVYPSIRTANPNTVVVPIRLVE